MKKGKLVLRGRHKLVFRFRIGDFLPPILFVGFLLFLENDIVYVWPLTSHSAYVATETKLHGAKIDGFLYPNFM